MLLLSVLFLAINSIVISEAVTSTIQMEKFEIADVCEEAYGAILNTHYNVRIAIQCGLKCGHEQSCKSFTYNSRTGICVTNNGTLNGTATGCNEYMKYGRKLSGGVCVHGDFVHVVLGATTYKYCHCEATYFGRQCDSDLITAMQAGVRVIPGAHWKWGVQNSPGTLTSNGVTPEGWVEVAWDDASTASTTYVRMGGEAAYDLFFI